MRTKIWFSSKVFILVSVLAGFPCPGPAAGGQEKGPSTPGKTVEIDEIGSTAHVSLNVGDTLRVLLQANPSTGYGWQVAENNDALLKGSVREDLPPESTEPEAKAEAKRKAKFKGKLRPKPGAQGRQSFTFTALAAGRNRLVLAYTRPWEKNVAPARSLTLEVVIRDRTLRGDPAFSVKPAGSLRGIYTGKLPCADCSGIQETLSLYSPGPDQFVNAYYVQAMTYLGARNGDVTNVTAGTWFVERGTPSDPNATVYALSVASTDRSDYYLVKANALNPLDRERRPVQSPFNLALHKVP